MLVLGLFAGMPTAAFLGESMVVVVVIDNVGHLFVVWNHDIVVYRSHAKSVPNDVAVPVVDMEAVSGFQVPELGRRKRRLVSNPSGLMF